MIESHLFEVVEKVTASFGVSSYINGDDVKSILKRADDALYEAKKKWQKQSLCTGKKLTT